LPVLTISRLKDARTCSRLHHLRYDLGYRPLLERPEKAIGSATHIGLEAWWLARRADPENAHPGAPLVAALSAVDAGRWERVLGWDDVTRVGEMLVGYDERWRGEHFEVLAVEVAFACPLVNPRTGAKSKSWALAGKIDAIVRAPNGRVLIVEHKTASGEVGPGSEYRRRLTMDGQIAMYHLGARSLGFEVDGCLYDVLRKPAIRPYKAGARRKEDETPDDFRERMRAAIDEAPGDYYQRFEINRLESEMEDFQLDLWHEGQRIRADHVARRAPRNPGACLQYGRSCEFLTVCASEASLTDPTLFRRATTTHEELPELPGVT